MNENEIASERAKLLSEARLQKSAMVRLLDTTEWKTYSSGLQEQIDRRVVELLTMPMGADDVIKKTYTTGELAGIKLALAYPQVLIEYAQSSIDSERVREERENGENTSGSNGGSGPRSGASDDYDDGDEFDITDGGGGARRAP